MDLELEEQLLIITLIPVAVKKKQQLKDLKRIKNFAKKKNLRRRDFIALGNHLEKVYGPFEGERERALTRLRREFEAEKLIDPASQKPSVDANPPVESEWTPEEFETAEKPVVNEPSHHAPEPSTIVDAGDHDSHRS